MHEKPKQIDKNGALERPKVENVVAAVWQVCRFLAGGVPTSKERIEDCIWKLPHADGPLARRILFLEHCFKTI